MGVKGIKTFLSIERFVDKSTERFINKEFLLEDGSVDKSTNFALGGRARRFIANTEAGWRY